MGLTHYQVLEVLPTASPEVIEAAYRARMKKIHPDHSSKHAIMAARVNDAHSILTDQDKRAEYDSTLIHPPGGLIGGKYRIVNKIAEGAIGVTYKAEHIELPGSFVCIKHAKQISPEYEEVMSHEAQAMWDLRHHAIPAIRDYVRLDDGSVALVMGFVEGPTLHDLVEQKGPIEAEDVAWIAERILNALKYLHYNGIIHGDLKPKNIIVQPSSHEVVLVDFGLAAVRPDDTAASLGYTPHFGSPESKKGLPLIPESDFYSLAATMLFAFSNDLEAVARRRVPSDLPDPLCDLLRRLLQTNPLDRPNWSTETLDDTLIAARQASFGRRRSGMKPIRHKKIKS